MPKTSAAIAHFDCAALLTRVHAQDVGLRVSTNNATGFRRIVYQAMRANPSLRIHIYQCPRSIKAFFLLKAPLPNIAAVEEPADDQ